MSTTIHWSPVSCLTIYLDSELQTFKLKKYYILLTGFQNNVGMHEPLVDAEGFPRNDIDLYQVRTARHKIICK